MITFDHDPRATASVEQWRSRAAWPTELGSADLRAFSSELHLRSVFSARVTNAQFLDEIARQVDDVLTGKINMATARWQLMKRLKQLGYDPAVGFPQDMANVPPAVRDSLQDLNSEQRLDLILRTNVAVARNYGRQRAGNTPFARHAWPAWELVRLGERETPRGERRDAHGGLKADPAHGWPRRWEAAGASVGWAGALQGRLIARKESPIWQALADGVGGFSDTLGHPFPPFAFNSGMDWRAVPRAEWETLSAGETPASPTGETPGPRATLAPSTTERRSVLERLSPDLAAKLKARWAQ